MTATETTGHLLHDSAGVLRIRGTGHKVIMLVGEHVNHGWDAGEMQRQHPELTLGQIHSVLSYYYDHAEELRTELAKREQDAGTALQKLSRDGKLRPIR